MPNQEFTWPESRVYDGMRQSASEATRRYRLLRNVDLHNRGALTKVRGIRDMYQTPLNGGAPVNGGMDCHFQDGTQQVVLHVGDGLYRWNSGDQVFADEGRTVANEQSHGVMFANRLILMNGEDFLSMTSVGSWTTVEQLPEIEGGGDGRIPRFGAMHAERLCVAGVSGNEHYIYPSAVRDENDFELQNIIVVEVPHDPGITNLANLGPFLVAQTQNGTIVYQKGVESPRDWGKWDVSMDIGCVSHRAWCTVSRGRGDNNRSYGFFWDRDEGPFMMMTTGGDRPVLIPLGDPIRHAIEGRERQGLPGLATAMVDQIQAVYAPEFNQVRFSCAQAGSTENNCYLAVDVDSAIAFGAGMLEYPHWVLRDNPNLELLQWTPAFPVSFMLPIRVGADGYPSSLGRRATHCGRAGILYRMDAPDTYLDLGQPIPLDIVRSGYSGRNDGLHNFNVAVAWAHLSATRVPDGRITMQIWNDGRGQSNSADIDLSLGLTLWGRSTWGGGFWGGREFINTRADFGINGTNFIVRLYDNGIIRNTFKVDSWELSGYVEDRR